MISRRARTSDVSEQRLILGRSWGAFHNHVIVRDPNEALFRGRADPAEEGRGKSAILRFRSDVPTAITRDEESRATALPIDVHGVEGDDAPIWGKERHDVLEEQSRLLVGQMV